MINFFTNGGGSGQIRGHQIAEKLKARINPKEIDDKDINIYVKDFPIGNIPKHIYIDVVEDSRGLRWVVSHPEAGIISSSLMIDAYLRKRTKRDDIVFIPQHHCNFERYVKQRGELKTVGIIGSKQTFQDSIPELKAKLKKIGVELKTLIKKKFKDRKEVCEFYKQIDVQLVWRKDTNLRNPLKLINAMSFGIPTIAYPEPCFEEEFKDCYLAVDTIDKMVAGVELLKEKTFYNAYAIIGINESQDYHIDFISELYKALK